MGYYCIINKEKSKFNKEGNIVKAVIKDSIKSIGGYAFYNCSGLTSVTIPDSVTSIGAGAFGSCISLKDYKNRYFKITQSDMSCRNRHYRMNKWYYLSKNKPIILCERGFHACTRPNECFNYYWGDISKLRFFEVKLGDIFDENYLTSKVVSNKIKFIKEYTFKEFIELANNS